MASQSNPPEQLGEKQKLVRSPDLKMINGRVALMVAAGVGLLIIVVVIVYMVLVSQPLVSPSKAKQADFSIYSPKSSPSGYRFIEERVSYSNSTFSYIFEEEDGGSELTVTIQPKPKSFNMAAMSEGGSINSTSTKNGALYNLSASGASQYLLDTGESLVFFRSSKAIDNATMSSLADDLVKIN